MRKNEGRRPEAAPSCGSGRKLYAPRLDGPVREGPFLGAGLEAGLTFSAFGAAAFRDGFGASPSGPPSPSGFCLRTVSTRPPEARRARSARDSFLGPFSLGSNL